MADANTTAHPSPSQPNDNDDASKSVIRWHDIERAIATIYGAREEMGRRTAERLRANAETRERRSHESE
jgi:hypothetical protein